MSQTFLCSIIALLVVVAFAQDKPAEEPAKLTLAEQPVEIFDLTDALGVRLWKVKAAFPPDTDQLDVRLEIHEADDTATEVVRAGTGGIAKADRHEGKIVVAVSFPDQQGEFRSEEIRCFLRAMSGYDSKTLPNPFKGASRMEFPTVALQKVENDQVILMQSKTKDNQDGPRLVLKIVTRN